jgi:signal peptidase II
MTKHLAKTSLSGTPPQSFFADMVRLEYAENIGGFLSIGASLPEKARVAIFTVGTAVVLFTSWIVALKLRWAGWNLLGISLAFGGGASNLIDRILHGSVIDFLNIGLGNLRTGIFNVADVAIFFGIVILMFSLPRERGSGV